MSNISTLPTSDKEKFEEMINKPNVGFNNISQKNTAISRVQKNIVLAYKSDDTGCGYIRTAFPMNYLNSVFGKSGRFNAFICPPGMFIYDQHILQKTRSIWFQRTMAPQQIPMVAQYKELQKKHKFKLIYDVDDFIWDGSAEGEEIPEYNFGKNTISPEVQRASIEIMKMMDIVCVSTKFLGDYIVSKGIDKDKIRVVHNTVSQAFWGSAKKPPITERIEKPRVLWSASPTHWHDQKELAGDMDNAWKGWVIENVRKGKIDFYQMGGLPFFFRPIKDKITVIPWLNSYQYHLAVINVNPHFGISPLVPNFFNYSKSCIKYQEYCAVGAVGIGTYFTNGEQSPYDVCKIKTPDNITLPEIDKLFDKLCEPDEFNKIREAQYHQMVKSHWYTESPGYVDMLMKIL